MNQHPPESKAAQQTSPDPGSSTPASGKSPDANGRPAITEPEAAVSAAEARAQKIPFWRVIVSVLQAGFGVQSPENRERDFVHGKILPFIVAALIFTGLFVLLLILVVNLVLS